MLPSSRRFGKTWPTSCTACIQRLRKTWPTSCTACIQTKAAMPRVSGFDVCLPVQFIFLVRQVPSVVLARCTDWFVCLIEGCLCQSWHDPRQQNAAPRLSGVNRSCLHASCKGPVMTLRYLQILCFLAQYIEVCHVFSCVVGLHGYLQMCVLCCLFALVDLSPLV